MERRKSAARLRGKGREGKEHPREFAIYARPSNPQNGIIYVRGEAHLTNPRPPLLFGRVYKDHGTTDPTELFALSREDFADVCKMYPELKSRLATIAEANMNRVNKVRSRTDSIYAPSAAPFEPPRRDLPELAGWIYWRDSELSIEWVACTPQAKGSVMFEIEIRQSFEAYLNPNP